jgi:hypothetical protein
LWKTSVENTIQSHLRRAIERNSQMLWMEKVSNDATKFEAS